RRAAGRALSRGVLVRGQLRGHLPGARSDRAQPASRHARQLEAAERVPAAGAVVRLTATNTAADTANATSNARSMLTSPWRGPGMPTRNAATPIAPPTHMAA